MLTEPSNAQPRSNACTHSPTAEQACAPGNDRVWQAALDWHLRLHEQPADAALQADFQAWHAAQPSHAENWRRVQRVWQLTGRLAAGNGRSAPALPAPRPPRMHAARHPRRLLGVGAALAACLLLVLLQLPGWQADYHTAPGERRTLSLSDGSQLTLDGASAITVQLDEQQRQVRVLKGRVYFQVRRDRGRPFQVMAGPASITVTGTAFNVEHTRTRASVAVEHGSVQVDAPASTAAALRTSLGAGDRLLLEQHLGKVQRSRQAPDRMAAWRQGRLIAENQPLAEVLEQLAAQQPGLLLLGDAALGQRRVTGVFDLNQADAALQALLAPLGARVNTYSPWLRVVEAGPEKNN